MPKAEWGVKRACPNCETRFYDLQRAPILCPECGTTYNVDDHGKVSATRERRAPVPVSEDEDALVDDDDLVEETEEEDAEDPLLADDDDDEDEEPAGPTLSDEDGEEGDTVAFKDAAIIEDDDEDAEDDEQVEEDEIDDLDDVPGKDKSD